MEEGFGDKSEVPQQSFEGAHGVNEDYEEAYDNPEFGESEEYEPEFAGEEEEEDEEPEIYQTEGPQLPKGSDLGVRKMIALYENLRRKLIEIIQKHMETNSQLAEKNVDMIMKNQALIDRWIQKFKLRNQDLPEIDEEHLPLFDYNEGDEITIDEENVVLREHLYLTQTFIKDRLTALVTKTASARARIDERLQHLAKAIHQIQDS